MACCLLLPGVLLRQGGRGWKPKQTEKKKKKKKKKLGLRREAARLAKGKRKTTSEPRGKGLDQQGERV
eukprot:m.67607 g.67607  ORF g.67607 m.67607 type:complete len:68 (+) comp16640_c0_seq1:130-333(+)